MRLRIVQITQTLVKITLRTIIDIGIESSLKRRESKYPTEFAKENDDNNFIEILESFIAVAFHFDIRDSREVCKKMEDF